MLRNTRIDSYSLLQWSFGMNLKCVSYFLFTLALVYLNAKAECTTECIVFTGALVGKQFRRLSWLLLLFLAIVST